jgi:DNA-binding NtrC family response regulator
MTSPSCEPIIVLVVEDELLVRMSAVDLVEEAGFVALEAANADDAMAVIEGHDTDIHIIFTDIDMPGSMDGLGLARTVRDRWPLMRIIVASGHRTPAQADLPSGAAFFAKPYDYDKVSETMRRMVS